MQRDDSARRHDDLAIAELAVKFNEFVARYERDVIKSDTDRSEVLRILMSHDEFIREIKPMYSKGIIAIGAFVLGSIGIATAWIWSHVRWG